MATLKPVGIDSTTWQWKTSVSTDTLWTSTQMTEWTNLYFTDERAQDAVGSMTSTEFVYNDATPSLSLRVLWFTNNPSHSIVSVAAAANGFQLSTTRNASIRYSVSVTTTVQIGVVTSVAGYVVLEIAATNSTTAGDRQEIGRIGNTNTVGLALAFSGTSVNTATVSWILPIGYYARLRSVNTAGTPTYAYISWQEALL